MSQIREQYQIKTEEAMFGNNIRSDLMEEEDLAGLFADQLVDKLLKSKDGKDVIVSTNDFLEKVPDSKVMDIDEIG